MQDNKEYYELTMYDPIDDSIYRVSEILFNTHEEGLAWLVEEYGSTSVLYSGAYVDVENFSRQESPRYISKYEVDNICTQAVSDLGKLLAAVRN